MSTPRINFPIDLAFLIWFNLGADQPILDAALASLQRDQAVQRVWNRDGSFWSQKPEVAREIEERLGWLDLPITMAPHLAQLRALSQEVRAEGITHIVLLGMGGSSLAPEVMGRILSIPPGYPQLTVLDSTDPTQIRQAAAVAPLAQTLFLVASKSGSTVETDTLLAYFRARMMAEVGHERWARHFIAITDPGTSLEKLGQAEGFRAVYANPPDIGGRYSALSLFGLVPAALIGLDLERLLARGQEMAGACHAAAPAGNPGLLLGAIMGALAHRAVPPRDKLTLFSSAELAPFGVWAEQLIAESTGKEGTGILPVEGEGLGSVADYGPDRLFVYLRLEGAENRASDILASALVEAGRPLVSLRLRDPYDLGAEFFRWEYATAVAGQVLGINPFDQPNVESAKVQARNALARYEASHALPRQEPVLAEAALTVYGSEQPAVSLAAYLDGFLAQAKPGDYVAIMAYIARDPVHDSLLQALRRAMSDRLRRSGKPLAVTTGYGPRFLHSTGQLHKGGPNDGLFIQITQEEREDLQIPGRPYTFGILKCAQALGDMEALQAAGRRVARIDLGSGVQEGLRTLTAAL